MTFPSPDFAILGGWGYSEDLTTQGGAIYSSQDGTKVAARMFDRDDVTDWQSATANTSGTTYIGQDFGAAFAHEIRRIRLRQSASATFCPNSISIQHSDNGSTWTTIAAGNTAVTTGDQTIDIAANGAHRYWRLLSRQTTAGVWSAFTLEMRKLYG